MLSGPSNSELPQGKAGKIVDFLIRSHQLDSERHIPVPEYLVQHVGVKAAPKRPVLSDAKEMPVTTTDVELTICRAIFKAPSGRKGGQNPCEWTEFL